MQIETREYYGYIGDNVGTDLERGTMYMVAAIGIDDVILHKSWGVESVAITKEEFNVHLEMGMLEKQDG